MMRQRRQSTSVLIACCYDNHNAYVLDPPNGLPTGVVFSTPTCLRRGSQISSTEAVLSGDGDNASVISFESGTLMKTMRGGHNGSNVCCTAHLVVSGLSQRLATGGYDNMIAIWDVDSGSVIARLQDHSSHVLSLMNPLNSEFLFSGSNDNSIKQWDIAQQTCVNAFTAHVGGVCDLCYDPNHHIVFSGSDDKTVKGWDHRSGESMITNLTFSTWVNSILFREESKENQLVVPVMGENIHLLDLRFISENGTAQGVDSWRHGHSMFVHGICDVPDQNLFVTSGYTDHHIKAWRENGTCVWDWTGPNRMSGLISFVNDYEAFVGITPLPPPPPTEEHHIAALTSERDELLTRVTLL